MKKRFVSAAFLVLVCAFALGQKDLNVKFMLRANLYAVSAMEDSTALGGYAASGNMPKPCDSRVNFPETGFFLKIDTSQRVILDGKYNGYKLFIVNKSKGIADINGTDSRLPVVAEVFHHGKWMPIEFLPSSWCGNSYHRIYLGSNTYWEFDVPKFKGKIKSKLRYRFEFDEAGYFYSNEIPVSFNKGQLKKKRNAYTNSF